MIAQSFLYNSVFFTFGLILANFYHVPEQHIGFYVLPLAIGNFCGPLLLGSLFDTVGRRKMIAGTFAVSGLLLLLTAYLFAAGFLTQVTQTAAWCVIFFFASAAASSAYLTASEIFPLETRALAIACFYAVGTAVGGSVSPLLFGWLIEFGIELEGERRLRGRCMLAPPRGRRRMEARHRCRRQVARKHRRPAVELIATAGNFAKARAPKRQVCLRFQSEHLCPALAAKIFIFRFFVNCASLSPSRLIEEGRTRRHDT